jgi:hypothetical protein
MDRLSRYAVTLLFNVKPFDAQTFAAVPVLLLLSAAARRLPVSSGEVATLTPEGVIAFWKFFGRRKGESRLEQTISD